jgi:hypothetical protein
VVLVAIMGLGALVAAVFLVVAGLGAAPGGRAGPLVGAAVFGVVGLALGGLAAWLHRRAHPPGLPHLQLTTDADETRRGRTVTVTLRNTTPGASGGGRLELGLVCTESYDYEHVTHGKDGRRSSRQTRQVAAHEEWRPVDPAAPEHEVAFALPAQAPFSFEGDCVSYAWKVSAREVRPKRIDARLDHPIWVLP